MTTATHPQAPGRAPEETSSPQRSQRSEQTITGRYRPISAQQLAMSWWLYQAGHITRRQLRITFAAHEMAEQRRYAGPERRGHARYRLRQLQQLVGGRGSQTAERELSADVKKLAEIGLVTITSRSIAFAGSIEDIRIEGVLDGFWTFFQAIPNPRRRVPVPRRTLRALAAGFSRAVTAYMLSALIRSVFWHRHAGGGGEYRVDGRTKLAWVANTFGVSRRAVTDARTHLIELGWLRPLEVEQWELNRWGVRDAVNVHWSPADAAPDSTERPTDRSTDSVDKSAAGEGRGSGESASPSGQNSGESASPCLNRSALPTGDSNTRKLGDKAPGPSGDCHPSKGKKPGKKRAAQPKSTPNIRDIQASDLKDPEALGKLRVQALALGFAFDGEGGALDFFALAHRALTRGRRSGALFFDLISNHRTAFITMADEEVARAQLRELRDGPDMRPRDGGGEEPLPKPRPLSEEAQIVETCLRVARQHRIEDPFRVLRHHPKAPGWARDEWDDACLRYHSEQARRWQPAGLWEELEVL